MGERRQTAPLDGGLAQTRVLDPEAGRKDDIRRGAELEPDGLATPFRRLNDFRQ